MIELGEPASAPGVVTAVDEAPLEYPFPGGKVPIIRASDRIVSGIPLNYPAPVASAETGVPAVTDVTFVKISHSIIAMAAPEPPVSFEEVAAVDKGADDSEAEERREFFGPVPTVIRGGVVDNGASAQAPVPAAPSQSAPSSRQPPRQPDAPAPSPTPAPPPASIIPQTKVQ
jgi:hypothetical protein